MGGKRARKAQDEVRAFNDEIERSTLAMQVQIAEQEAEAISKRTKAALAAAKERGTVLGGRRVSAIRFAEIGAQGRQAHSTQAAKKAAQVLPVIAEVQRQGITSLHGIASELNARGIDAPRGGQWSAVQVQRALRFHVPEGLRSQHYHRSVGI